MATGWRDRIDAHQLVIGMAILGVATFGILASAAWLEGARSWVILVLLIIGLAFTIGRGDRDDTPRDNCPACGARNPLTADTCAHCDTAFTRDR